MNDIIKPDKMVQYKTVIEFKYKNAIYLKYIARYPNIYTSIVWECRETDSISSFAMIYRSGQSLLNSFAAIPVSTVTDFFDWWISPQDYAYLL